MESEDEAPPIYEETNDDLVRLLESYGTGAGGVQPARDCQRSRIVRLGAARNSEWYRALAGALGLERLQDLFDSDEVAHSTAQCERVRDTKARARHKESAEETRLRDAVHRLQSDSERAAATLDFAELVDAPQALIQVFLQLQETRQDLALVAGDERVAGVADRLASRMAQFRTVERAAAEADDQFVGDRQSLDLAAFAPLTLFALYWDLAKARETSLQALLTAALSALRAASDQLYALRPLLLPGQPALPRASLSALDEAVARRLPAEWARLVGSESVLLPAMQACYDEAALRPMVARGCRLVYGARAEYCRLVDLYLFGGRGARPEDPLKQMNIFAGVDEDETGHPLPVWRVVRAFLPPEVTQYDERGSTPALLKQALLSHFLWCYMTRAPITRLALDWHTDGRAPEALHRGDVDAALEAVRQALGEYYSMLGLMLLDSARSPLLLHDVEARQPLFRLPLQMRAYDFGAAPPSERERSERLDRLNALFGAHTSVLDLVQNATLRRQMEGNRAAIAHFSALRYPVLLLFGVLDLYMKLVREAAPLLRLRLSEADAALQKLLAEAVIEDEDDAEEEAPTLPLRPDIEAALQLAYNKVQRFCKGLQRLPRTQLEARHADESGLRTDFLAFVRALADERGLLRCRSYRSRYQMRGAMMTTNEALQALKRYRYRKLGVHRYRSYHT